MNREKLIDALEIILEAPKEEWETLLRKFIHRLKTSDDQRTYKQNNGLHLFFDHLAESLNNSHLTVQLILSKKMDLEWDDRKVKEFLWRPAQEAILGKKSTTQLKKLEDIDKIYDHLVRHLGQKFGFQVPEFPHDDTVLKEKIYQD